MIDDVEHRGGLICPCGGPISKGALTGGRERWQCKACGRYEVMRAVDSQDDERREVGGQSSG